MLNFLRDSVFSVTTATVMVYVNHVGHCHCIIMHYYAKPTFHIYCKRERLNI